MNTWQEKILAVFAELGKIEEIPIEIPEDNSVSFKTGYTDHYSKKESLAQSITTYPIERVKLNYLFKLITSAIKELQETIPVYTTEDTNEQKVDIATITNKTIAFSILTDLLCIDNTGKANKITKEELIKQLKPDIDLSANNITVSEIAETALNNFLAIDGNTVKKANKLLQEVIEEIDLSANNVIISQKTTTENIDKIVITNTAGRTYKVDKLLQKHIDNINLSDDNISIEHIHTSGTTLKPLMVDENGKIKSEDYILSSLIKGHIKASSLNIQVIDETSSITSYDEIVEDGYYIINKNLNNKPQENYDTLIVISYTINNVKVIIQQCFKVNYYYPVYYTRQYYNAQWSSWELNKLSQDDIDNIDLSANNIIISKQITNTAINTFLITKTDGSIAKVEKDGIINGIVSEVNQGIDLTNYFNKNTDKLNLSLQVENILGEENGGNGNNLGVIGNIKSKSIEPSGIELRPPSATSNNGGVIDFHHNQSTKDYTSRIIESQSGRIDVVASNGLYINNSKVLSGTPNINTAFSGYPLSVDKGGHGTTDGFGWKNAYIDTEFNKKIGLSYPFTTQELATAIINTFKEPIFCMVAGWLRGENRITDFPGPILTHRTIINMSDLNQFYLETVDPFNLTTYICNVSGGVAGPWIKTRNPDGSIPMEVGGTPLVYTNDQGTWTETKLSDGTTMLEGSGYAYAGLGERYCYIPLPKSVNMSKSICIATFDGSFSTIGFIATRVLSNNIEISSIFNSEYIQSGRYVWYFKGIIQQ